MVLRVTNGACVTMIQITIKKKKRKKERKRFQSHTKTPMTTSLISLEGF